MDWFRNLVFDSVIDLADHNMIAAPHHPKQVDDLDAAEHAAQAALFVACNLLSDDEDE